MLNLIVALLITITDSACISAAQEYTQGGDYYKSLSLLKFVHNIQRSDYKFYTAVNYFSINDKKNAGKALTNLDFNSVDIPERYQVVARIMLAELDTWKKDRDDMPDISRDMKDVVNRIRNDNVSKETLAKQKDIVDRLTQKIDQLEKEQEEKSKQEGGGGGKGGKNNQRGNNGKAAGNQVAGPASEDSLPSGNAPGKVDQRKFKELTENWGKMPEKERVKAMRDLMQQMPPRHRELIENYFKKLAETK
jgi:hypothetical protein